MMVGFSSKTITGENCTVLEMSKGTIQLWPKGEFCPQSWHEKGIILLSPSINLSMHVVSMVTLKISDVPTSIFLLYVTTSREKVSI